MLTASGLATGPPQPTGPAYLLLELPSTRVVAVSRPDVIDTPVAPGSVIKVATLIAALEEGVVDATTRVLCRWTYQVDGRSLTCAHPDLHRPLGPAEALGQSCNVFFAAVAGRMKRGGLDDILIRLGLSPVNPAASTVPAALGLAGIRVTPRALLEAFVRATGGEPAFRMDNRSRTVVIEGLRIAATSGTASALGRAGIRALAKTGTAPMTGGGFQGLVVAVAPDVNPGYAVVVLAPGGAGADAAQIAADVLRKYANAGRLGGSGGLGEIRVGVARRAGGFDVVSMPLEPYVSRVVAGEMADGSPPSALEALAITVRTFAAANLGRHAGEGFDVCDLTHCQVVGHSSSGTDRATRATDGLVLLDRNQPAGVYFSAWCGGHTEQPSHVWKGAGDPSFLPARIDDACETKPGWRTDLPEPELRRVLAAAGLRGAEVGDLSVGSRFPSGRAATIRVAGMVPGQIDANTFRAAAGRLLGWQTVKSTLFDIRRTGVGYALTGRGLGHGVGLCVRGAGARGRHGAARNEILAAYFPGLVTGRFPERAHRAAPAAPSPRTTIRVLLPESDRQHLSEIQDLADRLVADVARRLGVRPPEIIELQFHPTVEAYVRASGQPWWTAARTRGTRVDVVPLEGLRSRRVLEPTLRHEFVHLCADPALAGRPLWVREGLAVWVAGESGPEATGAGQRGAVEGANRGPECPRDADLRDTLSPEVWRRAYQAAGLCVARALATGRRWQDLR